MGSGLSTNEPEQRRGRNIRKIKEEPWQREGKLENRKEPVEKRETLKKKKERKQKFRKHWKGERSSKN